MMMRNHNEILIQTHYRSVFLFFFFFYLPHLNKAMLHKLLQRFNVDMFITAICMCNQCFISTSVFFSLKPQSLSVAPLFVWNNLFKLGHKEDSRRGILAATLAKNAHLYPA